MPTAKAPRTLLLALSGALAAGCVAEPQPRLVADRIANSDRFVIEVDWYAHEDEGSPRIDAVKLEVDGRPAEVQVTVGGKSQPWGYVPTVAFGVPPSAGRFRVVIAVEYAGDRFLFTVPYRRCRRPGQGKWCRGAERLDRIGPARRHNP